MPDSTSQGLKRKKPPTFQHYPTNRAKALKKAWVEKQKIKSKWKAEKRKDISSSSKIELPEYRDREYQERTTPGHLPDVLNETIIEAPSQSAERDPELRTPHLHPSRAHLHPGHPVKRSVSAKSEPSPRPIKRPKIPAQEKAERTVGREQPSLRDLTREAYSPSTLHTFKSDPLKKKRAASKRGGKGADGRHHEGMTGRRGQPNMKLRMNAMLEKIKQDFA